MFTLNGKRIPYDIAWTHPDTGVHYPSNWMRLTTIQEKEAVGLVEEPDPEQGVWDQRFYWGPDNPKQLEDVSDDDGIISTGLKTHWKNQQSQIANTLLSPSDWRVIKAKETGTNIPATWKAYRAAVRTACNTRQTEIDSCADVAALKELLFGNPATATAWPEAID